jgi:hypothetical protein
MVKQTWLVYVSIGEVISLLLLMRTADSTVAVLAFNDFAGLS